jgi:hypothetical protein
VPKFNRLIRAVFLFMTEVTTFFKEPKIHDSKIVRQYLLERPICEKETNKSRCIQRAVHVHHKKFKSQGGDDNPDNLVALCLVHHAKEHRIRIKYGRLHWRAKRKSVL